jgi:hypothetical protein
MVGWSLCGEILTLKIQPPDFNAEGLPMVLFPDML